LYRLSLAEFLGSMIVLDDQLVQSDDNRIDWFRALLAEKAHNFQILVFTCRPGDYLAKRALVPDSAVYADTDGGFVRAIDLGRALRRRWPDALGQGRRRNVFVFDAWKKETARDDGGHRLQSDAAAEAVGGVGVSAPANSTAQPSNRLEAIDIHMNFAGVMGIGWR
jgi:hypothetical protein